MRGTIAAAALVLAGTMGFMAPVSGQTDGDAAPIYGVKIPDGYRDWALISVAHLGAPANDLRAKLGNEIAIKAYRAGTLPFPDGSIIARLAWTPTPSEENNKAFGPLLEKQLGAEAAKKALSESVVAGPALNVQFMVKDSKKYAATSGWGFAQFNDGKPADEALHKTCYGCHAPAKERDFVFSHYSR
jgi:hypothetical protein